MKKVGSIESILVAQFEILEEKIRKEQLLIIKINKL